MRPRVFAAFLCAIAAAQAPAIEIGAEFAMTNLGFPWSQVAPIPTTVPANANTFIYGGGFTTSQAISESVKISTSYYLDEVQRSLLDATIVYSTGILEIGFGPQFGVFNDIARPLTAGISSSIKLEIPGVVFASLRNSSSLGQSLGAIGDNSQERNRIDAGIYVRNAICSVSMDSRKFQIREAADLVTTDTMIDYAFEADIFKKNQPFNIVLSLGYRTASKEYMGTLASAKDSLGAFILGTKLKLRPHQSVSILLGFDSGVYTFGMDDLLVHGPAANEFYFKALAGLSIDTSKFGGRSAGLSPAERLEDITLPSTDQVDEATPRDGEGDASATPSDAAPADAATPSDAAPVDAPAN
jgi:hypothetical protein